MKPNNQLKAIEATSSSFYGIMEEINDVILKIDALTNSVKVVDKEMDKNEELSKMTKTMVEMTKKFKL